jgi:hypothetical protein
MIITLYTIACAWEASSKKAALLYKKVKADKSIS